MKKQALYPYILLNLTRMGVLTKHTIEWRIDFKRGTFNTLHARKGWRRRSIESLRALGMFNKPVTVALPAAEANAAA